MPNAPTILSLPLLLMRRRKGARQVQVQMPQGTSNMRIHITYAVGMKCDTSHRLPLLPSLIDAGGSPSFRRMDSLCNGNVSSFTGSLNISVLVRTERYTDQPVVHSLSTFCPHQRATRQFREQKSCGWKDLSRPRSEDVGLFFLVRD